MENGRIIIAEGDLAQTENLLLVREKDVTGLGSQNTLTKLFGPLLMDKYIIINESSERRRSGDVSVYKDIETAELSCEIYDVDDPSFFIFDSDGNLYVMKKLTKYSFEMVLKDLPENALSDLDFMLREYAHIIGFEKEWSLSAPLIEVMKKIYRNEPDPYAGR